MPSTNAQKLGIRPGCRVNVQGLALEQARPLLGPLPGDVILDSHAAADIVVLFAGSLADIEAKITDLQALVTPGGRLWVSYRKGATRKPSPDSAPPLHRDSLQQVLAAKQLTGVTLISLNDTWSCMRVKPT